MKPESRAVGQFLTASYQLHVPFYQRRYSWEQERWTDLWRDIAVQYRARGAERVTPHFMGCAILKRNSEHSSGDVTAFDIIDGQQRILSLACVAAALRDHMAFLNDSTIKPRNVLSAIPTDYEGMKQRFFAKEDDAKVLADILAGKFRDEIPERHYTHLLAGAYRFFRYQLWLGISSVVDHTPQLPPNPRAKKEGPPRGSFVHWGTIASSDHELELKALYEVVKTSLTILEILVEEHDEDAGVVFETMNAKSLQLSQFDLLRNSIHVRMPDEMRTFHDETWGLTESTLNGLSYDGLTRAPGEQFFYEYMIARSGEIITSDDGGLSRGRLHRIWLTDVIQELGYEVANDSQRQFKRKFVLPIVDAAFDYALIIGRSNRITRPDGDVVTLTQKQKDSIAEIMTMSKGPMVPLLLRAVAAKRTGALTDPELDTVLSDLQSYLVRLILAGQDLSPLRAAMIKAATQLQGPVSINDIRATLSKSGWLNDETVRDLALRLDTSEWSSPVLFPILRGINRHMAGRSAHKLPFGKGSDEWTVEHIYPQSKSGPGRQWMPDLAAWGTTVVEMDTLKYRLGNLTPVTGFDNSKNARQSFAVKKKLIEETEVIKIHSSFLDRDRWSPFEIEQRTALLVDHALEWWPCNSVPEAGLEGASPLARE